MSDTADSQPATDTPPMASTTGPDTSPPLLNPSLTTDPDAPSTKQASSETAEAGNEGVEVYGKPPESSTTGHGRRAKQPKPLTIRQAAYVRNLTDPSSATYGNKSQSALQAGYAHPERAWDLVANSSVQNAIEAHLEEINAGSKVRTGILAQLMQKRTAVTTQYDRNGDKVSETVSDNDKVQLQAIKELGKLDGSYHRAALTAHAQRKVLDPVLAAWGKRLRASLAPQQQAGAGDKQAIDVDSMVVEHAEQGTDALEGQGEGMAGSPGEGTEADGGGGG